MVLVPKSEGNSGPYSRTAVHKDFSNDLVFLYFELVVKPIADFEEVEDKIGKQRISVLVVVEVINEAVFDEVGPSD